MKIKMMFFLMSLIFVSSGVGYSQNVGNLLNKAKKKAAKTVEKRVEKEAEKAANKLMDKTIEKTEQKIKERNENKSKKVETEEKVATKPEEPNAATTEKKSAKKSEQKSEESVLNMLNKLSGAENVTYENSYIFNAEAKYFVESFDEKGKSNGQLIYRILLSDKNGNSCMIMESAENSENGESSIILYDEKNKVTIMLNPSENTGMAMGMTGSMRQEEANNYEQESEKNAEAENGELGFQKTGKSKNIAGYKCYEYLSKDKDTEMHVWTTKELKFSNNSSLSKLSAMNAANSISGYPNGYVMEMETLNLKDNSRGVFQVKEFSTSKSNKIDISKYKLSKMGSNF